MERHPHIHLFDTSKKWEYLIIGTFPPNTSLRHPDKLYIDYFYGNAGTLWKIIHDIYHDRGYDFFKGTRSENREEIIRWQNDYCVGLSDTILSCERKVPKSTNDSDIIIDKYNSDLRDYILENKTRLQKIIFTSSYGKNSAYENFKVIMGENISGISSKLVIGLPSPSGSANITFFNTNTEETLGLTRDFFNFVNNQYPETLIAFEKRWEQKKQKNKLPPGKREAAIVDATPKGLVTKFKLWKYTTALPQKKCK
ncbi:MAG: hypothetical protein ABI415_06805 [Flavitalea sp.]